MQRALYELLLGIQQTTLGEAQCTLKMLRTYPSLHHQSSETSLRVIPSQSRTNLVDFQQLAVIKSWSRQSIYHESAAMVWSVMLSGSNTLDNGIYHLPRDDVSEKSASWICLCLWEDVWCLAPSQIISIHHRQKGRTHTSHHAIMKSEGRNFQLSVHQSSTTL